jgi:hypothetical protein
VAETCERTAFEAVVGQASSALVDLNGRNTPIFQGKLRALKEKRGWSQEQLMKEGATFVRDDRIAAYDETTEQLLARINTQSGDGSDCKTLAALREAMQALVKAQVDKWAYMFAKLDRELAK